jgi:lipoprotein-anchoring transpeptidase ErfK/SrfK
MRRTRPGKTNHRNTFRAFRGAVAGALLAAGVPAAALAQPQLSSAPVAAARPLTTTLRLQADLAERAIYVWAGDSLLHMFPVAVGKPGHATPTGSFTIDRVIWNPGWVPPDAKWAQGKRARGPQDADNPMQAVKIFFREPDYYIHGTNRPETVGSAASHGCLRMRPEDAAELARLVMEHGGEPRDGLWVQETLRTGETRTVRLPMRVAMTVE